MLPIKQKILDKINETKEEDVEEFTWQTTPYSIKRFWANYFRQEQKFVDLPITNLNPNEK